MRVSRRLPERLREFFAAETDPINLAVLRIAVFGWILWLLLRIDFLQIARIPAALRVAPPGYGPFFHLIPWSEAWVSGMRYAGMIACAAALFGVATRLSATVGCLAALYLLALPELFGKINHTHHHLIWFSALLAAAPSGDALSVDALRARRPRPGPSRRYALPLRFAWLLIGLAYFFPGLAKLLAGPEWFLSDHLRNLMWEHWAAKDFIPVVRIDRYPLVYRSAAAATIAFEVGFLPSLFFLRLRPLAVAAGAAFHVLTFVYLGIAFHALLLCYVAFIDWAALLEHGKIRLAGREQAAADFAQERAPIGIAALGTLLLAANFCCSVFGIDSWPFAVYPRFAGIVREPERASVEVVIRDARGGTRPVPTGIRASSLQRSLAGGGNRAERIANLGRTLLSHGVRLDPGESLEIVEVVRSTRPEDRRRSPLTEKVLSRIDSSDVE